MLWGIVDVQEIEEVVEILPVFARISSPPATNAFIFWNLGRRALQIKCNLLISGKVLVALRL
jgi:hypothetical protein